MRAIAEYSATVRARTGGGSGSLAGPPTMAVWLAEANEQLAAVRTP